MIPFEYIVWEVPPSEEAVHALAWFIADELEFVRMIKESGPMLDDVLQPRASNAERCGLELGRAQSIARSVRAKQAARDALQYLESIDLAEFTSSDDRFGHRSLR